MSSQLKSGERTEEVVGDAEVYREVWGHAPGLLSGASGRVGQLSSVSGPVAALTNA